MSLGFLCIPTVVRFYVIRLARISIENIPYNRKQFKNRRYIMREYKARINVFGSRRLCKLGGPQCSVFY